MPLSSTKRFEPLKRSTVFPLDRVALLAAIGFATLPAAAIAKVAPVATAGTVSHAAQFVPHALDAALVGGVRPRSALPLVDPQRLAPGLLLQNNALLAGRSAFAPGAVGGSFNGTPAVSPMAFGNFSPQSIAPYTTARSSASVLGPTTTANAVAITSAPWRSTGLLLFSEPSGTYQCSASLIKPGLVVTAAHCVFPFGANSGSAFYTNETFYPAVYSNIAPYGSYAAANITIATAYYNGTDYCQTRGVVCNDDIAIITLSSTPGHSLGWYGYGWNGYSFVSSFGGASLASITELGYPVAFDSGRQQERTDGIGSYYGPSSLKNTILGTAQTGGSSGGPWLVNFGAPPVVNTAQASLGNSANANSIVGVTGWGYTTVGLNTQGASWFGQDISFPKNTYSDSHHIGRGAGNIGALIAAACSASFSSC